MTRPVLRTPAPPVAEPAAAPRRSYGGSRAVLLAATAVVTLLTWPVRDLTPRGNIDVSWQFALHQAALDGLRFGPDVLFTHGPLGFLVGPQMWSRPTAVAAVLFAVVAQAGLIAALLRVVRRFLPLPVAVLLVLVLTRVFVRPPSETLSLAVLVCALDLMQSRERPPRLGLWLALGIVITAVQSLVKLNSGVYCAVVLVVAVLALAERRLRTLGIAVGSGIAALLLLWVATGQRLGDLVTWVRGSVEMTSGYTAAMAVQEPGRGPEYVVAGVLALLVGLLVVRWYDGARLPFVVALLVLTTFIEAKHGFVRHNRHVLGLLAYLVVLPLALRLRPPARLPRVGVALLAAAASLYAAQGVVGVYLEESLTSLPRAAGQLRDLSSGERTAAAQAGWRAEFQRDYALPEPVLAELRGGEVQVDPYDTAVVWAYELDWAPVPVFQQYSTYTPALDEANAEVLAGPTAPTHVLRARTESIDERATPYEAPRYTLAVACRYAERVLTDRWQVLERTADRCGAERSLGSRSVRAGETVEVPRPSTSRSLVYARVLFEDGPLDALVETLYKPLSPTRITTDGLTRDLVRANAGGPLLLRVPSTAPVGPGRGDRVDVDRLSLSEDAVVELYELEVSP